ncbi:ABC transporter ATP-binding protein [Rufibacter quisquiliarum]|uniref:ABC-2 type transport system ATP-binding protein n=1 Tax=Rufibacter quisquiliarum TaxID=1549639 RepID=A0A839GRM5_9BACT|nr:ABC transporter ATP-binding protein [Rufibacter quisquiliarum]MBA9077496.1 ABC-2 type transport system ATP-binding protein [Rufibacter quisquiliarum]
MAGWYSLVADGWVMDFFWTSLRHHAMKDLLIHTQNLCYRYGRQNILKGLDLHIPKGSIYGFLGPNGAGKTTTIRLLLGLLHPTAGEVQLFGRELRQHRAEVLQKVGALIETPSLYRHLTGTENLEVMRRLLGVEKKRVAAVLEMVRLSADAHRPVRQYSLGMCQRLGIALALLSDPELLVLDEPTNGLDPSGIREMRQLLKDLNQQHGKTIFVSSHLLSEIEKTVTHLSILHQGKLSFEGSVQELQQVAIQANVLELEVANTLLARDVLLAHGLAVETMGGNWLRVAVQEKAEAAVLNQLLVEQGVPVTGLVFAQQSLEELFLSMTEVPSVETSIPQPLALV